MNNPSIFSLVLFALGWAIGIYLLNCSIAKGFKRINLKQAVIHYIAMGMLGLAGEISVGTVYHWLTGRAFWAYTVYPIHNAYTSRYALFLWGIYGFHLYLLHDTLKKRNIHSINQLAPLFCIEAVIIEAMVNITYKLSFHNFIYYYFPSDLGHFTSIQVLPFYLVAGYVVVLIFRKYELRPYLSSILGLSLITLLVLT